MHAIKTRPHIVFVGAGRLACNLAPALQAQGFAIVQIYSRTEASAHSLAERLHTEWTTDLARVCTDADVYIYALRDTVLPEIAQKLSVQENAIHLHTAGSMSMDVFTGKRHCGVLYPFQSFSKEQQADFRHIPILTEASDDTARTTLRSLAESLSDRVFDADGECRTRLHLAGVFANNFSNCMYALAEEQLHQAGLPFDILLPLIKETAEKVQRIPPRQAQTGPAIRHDYAVQERHKALLTDNDLKTLYNLISHNIESHEA